MEKNILIVAGEASSDLHAANLVKAINQLNPQIKFFGLGGKRLKASGVDLYFDIVELAVVGFFEVLKHLKKFREIFFGLVTEVERIKPDLAILVDYPGFNLRLAGELKKRGIPIIYYISPQVWAWGKKRLNLIKKLIERMIVIFKFEEALYKEYGIPVSFVGHPLLDIVKPRISKAEMFAQFGLKQDCLTFALLPGSREKEVRSLLPIMLDTARIISKEIANCQFLILRSSSVREEIFNQLIAHYTLPIYILSDMTYDGLTSSDFALVASGTATLETAILGIPMVILYKVAFPTWVYLRFTLKIPYIGLVNVAKQEKFIAEFIQYNAKPKRIARYILDTLNDKPRLNQIKQGLNEVTRSLGENGASLRAGRIICEYLNENKPH